MNLIFPNSVYHQKDLMPLAKALLSHQSGWTYEIGKTIHDWYNDSDTIELLTSGTTGENKLISLSKKAIQNSAQLSSKALNIPKGTNAFSGLPANYIGGKMMIIRALVLNWNLYLEQPSSNPISNLEDNIDFIAMTPHQLSTVLSQTPGQLSYIHKILLGGGPVSANLQSQIDQLKNKIYLGFGMTETISHIAIKNLNGPHKSGNYHALHGVTFSVDSEDCLVINASHLDAEVRTNDIVKLIDESTFIWLGRKDNVINSGGVKIYPEELENKLADKIKCPFYFFSEHDDHLGQKLVLIIEGPDLIDIDSINQSLLKLDKYQQPKSIYYIDKFQYTRTGKIKRSDSFKKLNIG